MTNVEPLKAWRKRNLPVEVMHLIVSGREHSFAYYIPREVVMYKPEAPFMNIARMYCVYAEDLQKLLPDKVIPARIEVRNSLGEVWGSDINYAYITEIWEDGGDDGHTNYYLWGYALLDRDQIKTLGIGDSDRTPWFARGYTDDRVDFRYYSVVERETE